MRLRSVFKRVKDVAKRHHPERYSALEWNQEYVSASWTYLGNLEQVPRYAVIEGWRRRLKPLGRVLDLGCGEGVLFEQIARTGVYYTGVDFSQVAIDAAARKIRDASFERFICADVVTFEPPEGCEVIIFNEVLYYLENPVAIVRRYWEALAPDGIVIVSIFHANLRTWKVINDVLRQYCCQTILVHDFASGKRWYLGLYQRPSRE